MCSAKQGYDRLITLDESHSACIDRCHPIDLELMLLVRLPRAMHLPPSDRPMQRLDEHHGIVMNWTRCSFEQSCLKCPSELIICRIIEGTDPQKIWE
jgi:hypothetical protein